MSLDSENDRSHVLKLLTVVTESVIESQLVRDIERLGARGYTITNARGKGSRGVREAGWETDSNIRLEVVCDEATAHRIASHLQLKYYDNYAMVLLLGEVEVLRPEKFQT